MKKLALFAFSLTLLCLKSYAMGGFDKATPWSARAALTGGAYTPSVKGGESLLFNPAGLIQEKSKEVGFGIGLISAQAKSPIHTSDDPKTGGKSMMVPAFTYAQQLGDDQAFGIGFYGVGGTGTDLQNTSFAHLGSEFTGFTGDNYALFQVAELGLGYARKVSSNLTLGATLRGTFSRGQLGVSEILQVPGAGVPIAVTESKFNDLQGFSFGAVKLGLQYLNNAKTVGFGLTYRSKVDLKMRSEAEGKIAYSNAGATAVGGGVIAGQHYQLKDTESTVIMPLPESLTAGGFKEILPDNRLHLEYSWTKYSDMNKIRLNSQLVNSANNSVIDVPDVETRWHDMHDLRLGWTNTSLKDWIIGGGYSYSTTVSNRNFMKASFLPSGPFNHYYLGVGRVAASWRLDVAAEFLESSAFGKTQRTESSGLETPSVRGNHSLRGMGLSSSLSYYF